MSAELCHRAVAAEAHTPRVADPRDAPGSTIRIRQSTPATEEPSEAVKPKSELRSQKQ